jgi:hypothetical protein
MNNKSSWYSSEALQYHASFFLNNILPFSAICWGSYYSPQPTSFAAGEKLSHEERQAPDEQIE